MNITLYHGSKNGLNGKIQPISRKLCDFGQGFYMGTSMEQPSTLICNYSDSILYTLELDDSNLKTVELPLNLDWALFVAYNRGKIPESATKIISNTLSLINEVDIIKGYIANDRMYVVLDRFFDGEITDKALVESLSALKLGIQYVAITQKACNAIKIIDEKKFSTKERESLIIKSEENRQSGISLANEICKKFRREGRYFDEIISD
ncbi:MAG: DUF3990 domain-containing protein [Treponema sp.]|nr:DUF3990 domain-containing protein [Treponema sp.]